VQSVERHNFGGPFGRKRAPSAMSSSLGWRPGQHAAKAGILAIAVCALGCSRGQEVTPEALAQARQLWKDAGISDYELEWTATGPNNVHYDVTVQGGQVKTVIAVQPDGQQVERHPPDSRFYSMDGLFLTIADELAQLKTDRPFNQPQGTKVLTRFQPDSKLGYPHWYRRDVMGTSQAMRIDVVKLVPSAVTSQASKQ
jgi:hypothetical protein